MDVCPATAKLQLAPCNQTRPQEHPCPGLVSCHYNDELSPRVFRPTMSCEKDAFLQRDGDRFLNEIYGLCSTNSNQLELLDRVRLCHYNWSV